MWLPPVNASRTAPLASPARRSLPLQTHPAARPATTGLRATVMKVAKGEKAVDGGDAAAAAAVGGGMTHAGKTRGAKAARTSIATNVEGWAVSRKAKAIAAS